MTPGQNQNSAPQSNVSGWGLKAILRDIAITWQLMRDPQVSFFLKLCLPVFALLYWISPIDLLVGMPFDDIAVIVAATRMFVQFAPHEAVERALMRMGISTPHATRASSAGQTYGPDMDEPDRDVWDIWEEDDTDSNTISGEWRVVDD